MDWLTATAADLGRAVREGRADPLEVVEAFLDAVAAHDDGTRVYARLTPERARAEAGAARERARAGTPRGPLDGVPLSWKDLFDTAGTRTEGGTALLAGRTPARDAAVLRAATLAGTVCLGKTHMTEIAFSGLGLNPVTATPPNVHDPLRLAGGSSSGAAASVAWGLAPAAVGSDTGGSIRLPAAWNDLVGWKPAHGGLSLGGVVPLAPAFDTVGPIARSVEDASLAWGALGGPRVDLAGASLAGAVIGVLRSVVAEDVEDAPARALAGALSRLEGAGARIVDLALPGLPRAYALGQPLYAGEVWARWGEAIEGGADRMFPPVVARASAGRDVSAAEYLRARDELGAIRAGAHDALAGLDAVACATCAILPPLAAEVEADHEAFRVANLAALRNTRMANLMNLASISLPTGAPSCGLMLSAVPGRERALLRLAAAAEAALA